MTHIVRRTAETAYVTGVAVLAVLGGVLQDGHYYLAAILLTLPAGIAGAVAVYAGYAALTLAGTMAGLALTGPDGDQAAWLATASGVLDVVVLVAAAVLNTVLVRALARRREDLLRELFTFSRPQQR